MEKAKVEPGPVVDIMAKADKIMDRKAFWQGHRKFLLALVVFIGTAYLMNGKKISEDTFLAVTLVIPGTFMGINFAKEVFNKFEVTRKQ